MGVYNAELFNNLGLCCFYAQQYDMTLSSFERAISLSTDDLTTSDIWYNIGQVAQVRCKVSQKRLFYDVSEITFVQMLLFSIFIQANICDAIKQNESEVENFWYVFFGIFYYGII